ncbi:hypothetical protein [Sphingomonas sp.]|uniref:hypothetical protein n=1 Tax=Sphingomonas sp. TaxID=28214 RepID=UPI0031E46D04
MSSRVRRAGARAARRRDGAVIDMLLDDEARLTDQLRLMLTRRLADLVETIARDLRHQAARLIADEGRDGAALPPIDAMARLRRAGLVADPLLVDEILAQLRQTLLSDALPAESLASDAPSLLVRLTESPDRIVASAARAVLSSEGQIRAGGEGLGLPDMLYRPLVWNVAAALRDGDDPAVDHALAGAAERLIASRGEGERAGTAARRLVAAIDARVAELPDLLIECLSDRQLGVFIAFIAHAARLDDRDVREIVLEPEGDRLWLLLRMLDMDRATIARIGLCLSDADGRRDVEQFADALDAIMAVSPADARRALSSLMLPAAFREAIDRLDGEPRR